MKKILTCLLMITLIIGISCDVLVYGVTGDYTPVAPNPGAANDKVNKIVGNGWATFTVVVQALALGAVVFAGLRYMFASADQRADIKKRFNLFSSRCYFNILCIYSC